MEITVVGLEDISELQLISKETFADTFREQNTSADLELFLKRNFSLEKLTIELNNAESTFYFLMEGNNVSGYLKVNRGHAQTEYFGDKALEIERIYVRKRAQGKGYGKALLDKAMRVLIEQNLTMLWLGVWESNISAIRFYEKSGFIPFSEHIFMLGNDPQRDILMKLDR